MGKILIGSPVCQSPIILNSFFASLAMLDVPGYEIFYHFIDDNHDELSKSILKNFQESTENVKLESPLKNDDSGIYFNHNWSQDKILKVAAFKNSIIDRARREGFDYLFLIDSDILLYPQTVSHLIETGKDIISEVFWTKWSPDSMEQPQVWMSDFYKQYEIQPGEAITEEEEAKRTFEFFDRLRVPGIYRVGGLGACTLISKAAIEKGVSFSLIDNLSFWGEDRHFCVRARVLGLELFVDTHYPAYHVFRAEELLAGIEFLKRFSSGNI